MVDVVGIATPVDMVLELEKAFDKGLTHLAIAQLPAMTIQGSGVRALASKSGTVLASLAHCLRTATDGTRTSLHALSPIVVVQLTTSIL